MGGWGGKVEKSRPKVANEKKRGRCGGDRTQLQEMISNDLPKQEKDQKCVEWGGKGDRFRANNSTSSVVGGRDAEEGEKGDGG